MRPSRILICIVTLSASLSIVALAAFASPFVLFPKTTELVSPDGRLCRNYELCLRFRRNLPLPLALRTGHRTFPQTLRLPRRSLGRLVQR